MYIHIYLHMQGRDSYEKQYGSRNLGRKIVKCFNCKQKGQHQMTNCPHPIVSCSNIVSSHVHKWLGVVHEERLGNIFREL